MPEDKGPPAGEEPRTHGQKRVTLKDLAAALDLSPATISVVLNRTPAADAIPADTQERIFEAARASNYRPNLMARSLRRQRSCSVGVLVPEISEGYASGIVGGIEARLVAEDYFTLVASHWSDPARLHRYLDLLRDRHVDGLVLVNTRLPASPGIPSVAVAGHEPLEGVTNVVIDHDAAARQALAHLAGLGHERVAFFKGHPGSADTEDRWRAIETMAPKFSIDVRPELTVQLSGESDAPEFAAEDGYAEGYAFAQLLLKRGQDFSALFAFNDVSAIGAMRAFFDAGLRVPEAISVVGFDDIQSAAFQKPSLTTVRQPLHAMGELAAATLLQRLGNGGSHEQEITVKPELIVRSSTGPAPGTATAMPRGEAGRGSATSAGLEDPR